MDQPVVISAASTNHLDIHRSENCFGRIASHCAHSSLISRLWWNHSCWRAFGSCHEMGPSSIGLGDPTEVTINRYHGFGSTLTWWWIPFIFGFSLAMGENDAERELSHLEQETMFFWLTSKRLWHTHTLRLVISWQSWHPLSASISPMTPMILDQIWRRQPFFPRKMGVSWRKMVISWGYNGDMHNLIWWWFHVYMDIYIYI